MYCPNCGSNNLAEVKFCTRCGTNLGVVTDALANKAVGNQLDERVMKLIKDYYRGRRDAITGAVLIPAGLLVMGILVFSGMPAIASFFIICWMFFWGAAALAAGMGKWFAASGELKALGYSSPQNALSRPAGEHSITSGQADNSAKTGVITGPIIIPGSVTEQTTRQLDEKVYQPPLENNSKQTQ